MSNKSKTKNSNNTNYRTNHGRENVFNPDQVKVKLLSLEETLLATDNGNKMENSSGMMSSHQQEFNNIEPSRVWY